MGETARKLMEERDAAQRLVRESEAAHEAELCALRKELEEAQAEGDREAAALRRRMEEAEAARDRDMLAVCDELKDSQAQVTEVRCVAGNHNWFFAWQPGGPIAAPALPLPHPHPSLHAALGEFGGVAGGA
jgi:phage-related minor tail protein